MTRALLTLFVAWLLILIVDAAMPEPISARWAVKRWDNAAPRPTHHVSYTAKKARFFRMTLDFGGSRLRKRQFSYITSSGHVTNNPSQATIFSINDGELFANDQVISANTDDDFILFQANIGIGTITKTWSKGDSFGLIWRNESFTFGGPDGGNRAQYCQGSDSRVYIILKQSPPACNPVAASPLPIPPAPTSVPGAPASVASNTELKMFGDVQTSTSGITSRSSTRSVSTTNVIQTSTKPVSSSRSISSTIPMLPSTSPIVSRTSTLALTSSTASFKPVLSSSSRSASSVVPSALLPGRSTSILSSGTSRSTPALPSLISSTLSRSSTSPTTKRSSASSSSSLPVTLSSTVLPRATTSVLTTKAPLSSSLAAPSLSRTSASVTFSSAILSSTIKPSSSLSSRASTSSSIVVVSATISPTSPFSSISSSVPVTSTALVSSTSIATSATRNTGLVPIIISSSTPISPSLSSRPAVSIPALSSTQNLFTLVTSSISSTSSRSSSTTLRSTSLRPSSTVSPTIISTSTLLSSTTLSLSSFLSSTKILAPSSTPIVSSSLVLPIISSSTQLTSTTPSSTIPLSSTVASTTLVSSTQGISTTLLSTSSAQASSTVIPSSTALLTTTSIPSTTSPTSTTASSTTLLQVTSSTVVATPTPTLSPPRPLCSGAPSFFFAVGSDNYGVSCTSHFGYDSRQREIGNVLSLDNCTTYCSQYRLNGSLLCLGTAYNPFAKACFLLTTLNSNFSDAYPAISTFLLFTPGVSETAACPQDSGKTYTSIDGDQYAVRCMEAVSQSSAYTTNPSNNAADCAESCSSDTRDINGQICQGATFAGGQCTLYSNISYAGGNSGVFGLVLLSPPEPLCPGGDQGNFMTTGATYTISCTSHFSVTANSVVLSNIPSLASCLYQCTAYQQYASFSCIGVTMANTTCFLLNSLEGNVTDNRGVSAWVTMSGQSTMTATCPDESGALYSADGATQLWSAECYQLYAPISSFFSILPSTNGLPFCMETCSTFNDNGILCTSTALFSGRCRFYNNTPSYTGPNPAFQWAIPYTASD